jgi:hypothetical protein
MNNNNNNNNNNNTKKKRRRKKKKKKKKKKKNHPGAMVRSISGLPLTQQIQERSRARPCKVYIT